MMKGRMGIGQYGEVGKFVEEGDWGVWGWRVQYRK